MIDSSHRIASASRIQLCFCSAPTTRAHRPSSFFFVETSALRNTQIFFCLDFGILRNGKRTRKQSNDNIGWSSRRRHPTPHWCAIVLCGVSFFLYTCACVCLSTLVLVVHLCVRLSVYIGAGCTLVRLSVYVGVGCAFVRLSVCLRWCWFDYLHSLVCFGLPVVNRQMAAHFVHHQRSYRLDGHHTHGYETACRAHCNRICC